MFPPDTDFDTDVSLKTESTPTAEIPPFNILLLGNWSGRENRQSEANLMNLRPVEIDRDNYGNVMKELRVGIDLEFQGNKESVLSLEFNNPDDFHPDKIFQQLPLFANLRDIRRKLSKADTFEKAAEEVRSWLVADENTEEAETKAKTVLPKTSMPSPDNLLDQILSHKNEKDSKFQLQTVEKSELSSLIGEIVKPYLIQTDAAEQSKLLMIVDEVISDLMRKILHHRKFQELESAWRGVFFLTKRIETSSDLKIYLLDISKEKMESDLRAADDLADSFMFQTVKSGIVGLSKQESWAVVCGNYTFSLNVDDVASLIRLAKISENTNTPFISHIKPEMLGFESFGELENYQSWKISEESNQYKLWKTLRSLPESKYLGLALPRFLARLPYGEQTEPTESFCFEEYLDFVPHEKYLWTNPAFACALLLAETYNKYGWNIPQNLITEIGDLPVHLYRENDKAKHKSCAEIVMTQNNCQQISEQGLMPLTSFLNTDYVRLGAFQSISKSTTKLEGKWNQD